MFLKNKNIIFKIRRSKVTDYAALIHSGGGGGGGGYFVNTLEVWATRNIFKKISGGD